VAEAVFQQAHALEVRDEGSEEEKLKEWLDSLTPEDIGKYKM
jgi:hypothetical protein